MSEEEEYEYDYGSDDSYNYGSDIGNDDNDMNVSDDLIEIENAFYGIKIFFLYSMRIQF
jgi:hypothetical protein